MHNPCGDLSEWKFHRYFIDFGAMGKFIGNETKTTKYTSILLVEKQVSKKLSKHQCTPFKI